MAKASDWAKKQRAKGIARAKAETPKKYRGRPRPPKFHPRIGEIAAAISSLREHFFAKLAGMPSDSNRWRRRQRKLRLDGYRSNSPVVTAIKQEVAAYFDINPRTMANQLANFKGSSKFLVPPEWFDWLENEIEEHYRDRAKRARAGWTEYQYAKILHLSSQPPEPPRKPFETRPKDFSWHDNVPDNIDPSAAEPICDALETEWQEDVRRQIDKQLPDNI